MQKKERIYLIVLISLFVAYVATDFLAPKPINWNVSFQTNDKNPFGAYILNERSIDLFENGLESSFKTISELEEKKNLLILAEYAEIEGTDFDNVIKLMSSGGNVWIGANAYSSKLLDTLGLEIEGSFEMLNQNIFEAPKSNLILYDSSAFSYPSSIINNFFLLDREDDWEILARVDEKPVVIQRSFRNGIITLNSIPLIFSNFGLLVNDNYPAAAKLLSLLPKKDIHYTMFYHSGKRDESTPLRYFLRQDSLRWSIYLSLFTIICFLLISSQRRQKSIQVIEPPKNTTVEYVKTLGALFFREQDHKKAAIKVINHFIGSLRERYYVSVDYSERFYQTLASKSNVPVEEVIRTFELIALVKERHTIEEKILIELTHKIELFK